MNKETRLCDLLPGETAYIKELLATGSIRRRFLDIGLIQKTPVTCLGKSPLGDPAAFLIRGTVIAIRKKDSQTILVEPPKNIITAMPDLTESQKGHTHEA